MEERCYSVYVHISPSGKRYFGITRQDPVSRWHNGKGYKGNLYFYRAIMKYGWDGFSHYILASSLSKSEAELIEIDLIKENKSNTKEFGYNIENGGNCAGTHSDETKRKIAEKNKGNKNCAGRVLSDWHKQQLIKSNIGNRRNTGRKATEETRRKISNALTGKKHSEEHVKNWLKSRKSMSGVNNPMYGKQHSDETKKKISDAVRLMSGSEGNKIRLKALQRKNEKKVIQLSMDMTALEVFDSVGRAAIAVGGNSQNVGYACRNTNRTYKGFYWRYYNENNN